MGCVLVENLISVCEDFFHSILFVPLQLSLQVSVWWDLAPPLALGLTLFRLSPKLLEAQTPNRTQRCVVKASGRSVPNALQLWFPFQSVVFFSCGSALPEISKWLQRCHWGVWLFCEVFGL